jgi:hypothetical protein
MHAQSGYAKSLLEGLTAGLEFCIRGGGPGSMSQDEYRRRALECTALARLVKDPDQAALLLGMAQAWLRLAMFRDTADIAVIATQTETDQEE